MSVATLDKIIVTTDGACLGNPGPGGWAALLRFNKREKMISGGEADSTNNRMELMAVIEGLAALKRRCSVTIVTDSQYVINGFQEGWVKKWEANGWKTAAKKPVKNQDLWESLLAHVEQHHVKWEWVKGHSGHPDNERVDEEARTQAEKFR